MMEYWRREIAEWRRRQTRLDADDEGGGYTRIGVSPGSRKPPETHSGSKGGVKAVVTMRVTTEPVPIRRPVVVCQRIWTGSLAISARPS
jgi:hypothetical protein